MSISLLFCVLQATMAPSTQFMLISAIEQHESGANDHAVAYECYGRLQIRQECLDDVNDHYGTHYKLKDVLGNKDLSVNIFQKYTELYATEERLGRTPTQKDIARIWNGGPDGWKKKSTLGYWTQVKRLMSPR